MNAIQERKKSLQSAFRGCTTKEAIYRKVMELGENLSPFNSAHKVETYRVSGCQSTTHIYFYQKDEKFFYQADSDALIAKGLAYLVTTYYSGLTPKEILVTNPTFLQELGIVGSLSMTRANGLMEMILFVKKAAARSLGVTLP